MICQFQTHDLPVIPLFSKWFWNALDFFNHILRCQLRLRWCAGIKDEQSAEQRDIDETPTSFNKQYCQVGGNEFEGNVETLRLVCNLWVFFENTWLFFFSENAAYF